jgi:radical SAM superfamily enzyme YgiQ (UPF0313 family)/tetratricopeptide (TPR) repeat protein
MKILFENAKTISPQVSVVLLDWSCRESFHALRYLNNQTVPREQYEIVWIEYYGRRSPEIENGLKENEALGQPPIVDQWIVMGMPGDVYYHKHLMYNIGIFVSRGRIVVICDSDAIFQPTFIESIIAAFKKDPHIVLHLDEVRNEDKRFHPFNYPSLEEVIGKGCINWAKGKTTGLLEKKDPLHARNYGACMCALKEDLVSIGGADEHIDYLGHICGPYELTFRLMNAGKKEVWHPKEFLYHTWHPGSDGLNNYLGPHDGKNLSSKALEAIETKRVFPLLENPVIKLIRSREPAALVSRECLFDQLINKNAVAGWRIDDNKFLMSLGRIAYHRKEYEEALLHWQKLPDPAIFGSQFLSELGWAYYFVVNYDEAVKVFTEALSLHPDHQPALVGLGWAYIKQNFPDKAKDVFQKAINIKSSQPSDLLSEAFRGLLLAKDLLLHDAGSRPFQKENWRSGKNFAAFAEHIFLLLKVYGFRIRQRIKAGDFSVPHNVRQKIRASILRRVFNMTSAEMNSLDQKKVIRGRAEYDRYLGYPCDVPKFQVKPRLDFLLLELPPRYVPMMPNGVAYVHNILAKCGVSFQTIDMNIIIYHKYHERRIRKRLNPLIMPSGYEMPEDPWDNTNMAEWDRPEVIAYFKTDLQKLLAEIVQNRPKAVGISLNGNNRSLAREFIKELRLSAPDIAIVVGGYDCIYHGLGQFLFPDFDYMVIGEAELTLESLVKALARGERPKDLTGIVSRYDSPERVWEKTPLPQDLDAIDFPKYPWAPHVWYQDCERKHMIPITASRGCSWGRCRFCGECFTFRKRNPIKVADEIEFHTKLGFHTFHFNESDVNGDPNVLHDLCSEIIRRELNVRLVAQLRVDRRNTAEYFKHLARAGFTHLRFGVDGWTDHLLQLQNKGYTKAIAFQNLRDCFASGIRTTVNMVIGVPGETEEDVQEAIENVIHCKDYISVVESFNTLLLVAGSEYYRNPDKYKIRFRENKEDIYKKHLHFVPAELWYSEDPYIDQEVRMRRLEKIIAALYKKGVDIGSFASKVVENLRSDRSKTVEVEMSEACIGEPGSPV